MSLFFLPTPNCIFTLMQSTLKNHIPEAAMASVLQLLEHDNLFVKSKAGT